MSNSAKSFEDFNWELVAESIGGQLLSVSVVERRVEIRTADDLLVVRDLGGLELLVSRVTIVGAPVPYFNYNFEIGERTVGHRILQTAQGVPVNLTLDYDKASRGGKKK